MNKIITIADKDVAKMKREAIDFGHKSFKKYLEELVKQGRERVLLNKNRKP
jgi:hypothetical protein